MANTKALNRKVVKDTFLELLKKYKSTTTLDIKTALRNEGYYAIQKDVSKYMQSIASEDDIDFTNNGTYNTFYSKDFDDVKTLHKSTTYSSKTNPIYNNIIDIICNNHSHLDSNYINGSSQFKFDLGLDDTEKLEIINQVEKTESIDLSDVDINNISNIRDLLILADSKKTSTSSINFISPVTVNTDFYINSNNKKIETSKYLNKFGNWQVSSLSQSEILEFDNTYTRDEVRMAYSKILNVKFINTRAKKIK